MCKKNKLNIKVKRSILTDSICHYITCSSLKRGYRLGFINNNNTNKKPYRSEDHFKKLDVVFSTPDTEFFRGLNNNQSSKIAEISNILKEKNRTLEQKQAALENLNSLHQKTNSLMLATLPKCEIFKGFIELLNKITSETDPLKMTASSVYSTYRKDKDLVSNYKPRKDKLKFIQFIILFFRTNKYLGFNNGLLITFLISKAIKEDIFSYDIDDEKVNKKSINSLFKYDPKSKKRVYVRKLSGIYLKTTTLSSISNDLLITLGFIRNMALKLIKSKEVPLNKEETYLLEALGDKSLLDTDNSYPGLLSALLAVFLECSGLFLEDNLNKLTPNPERRNVYIIDESFLRSLLELHFDYAILPNISKPLDWIFSRSSDGGINLHSGGRSLNKLLLTPAYMTRNNKAIANSTLHDLEAINYLQSTTFGINKDFLLFLYKNFYSSAIHYIYLDKIPARNLILVKPVESGSATVVSLETFLEGDDVSRNIQKQLNNLAENDRINEQSRLDQRQAMLSQKYKNLILRLFEFLNTLSIAELFSDYLHYYSVVFDFRGRLYYPSHPIGPQNSSLGSSLIEPNYNSFPDSSIHKKEYSLFTGNIKNNSKEHFLYLKHSNGFSFNFIGLDVSCSGIQIISAVMGFEEGLIKTNFLIEESLYHEGTKRDLYQDFLDFYLFSYPTKFPFDNIRSDLEPNDLCENLSSEIEDIDLNSTDQVDKTKNKSKKNYLNVSGDLKTISSDVLLALKKFFDRKNIKDWIMCFVYSEGNRSRAVKLMKHYDAKRFLFPKIDGPDARKLVYHICYFLSKEFVTLMSQRYPPLIEFSNFIITNVACKDLVSKNGGVWLCAGSDHLQVFYTEPKLVKRTFEHLNKEFKRVRFTMLVDSGTIDPRKFSNSLMPNYIHFLDSRVAISVINLCKKNNIPVYVNHDCFYTLTHFADTVRGFYFESLYEIILEKDILAHFFFSNKVDIKDYEDFINKVNENKEALLSKIEKKTLVMSKHILC